MCTQTNHKWSIMGDYDIDERRLVEIHHRWLGVLRERGVTVKVLSEFLGVSESTIRRWNGTNSGYAAPTTALIVCCERWDISPTWLYWGIGPQRLTHFERMDESMRLFGEIAERVDKLRQI